MANYSFLTVCAHDGFPAPQQQADAEWSPYPPLAESAPWYEAKHSIPLFWLCLFSENHLRSITLPVAGEDSTGTAVPALFAPQNEAAANLRRRRPLLARVLSAPELALYDEFTGRVAQKYAPFVLVITEEVALMSDEGELAEEIAEALSSMETLPPEEWTGQFAFINVVGLEEGAPIGNPGWYTLIGYDTVSHWPEEPEESHRQREAAAASAISPEVIALYEAANAGEVAAQCALGWALFRGEGVPQNPVRAWSWFLKAAHLGHAESQFIVARMHAEGLGIPQCYQPAVEWLQKAADQGYAEAQTSLGFHYQNGLGVTADTREALRWYTAAAEQGFATAQFNLGLLRTFNDEVRDEAEGVRWLQKAAEQGHLDAMQNLGALYKEGSEPDTATAFAWFLKAAEKGLPEAQFQVGYAYHAGSGVEKDSEKAVHWYRQSVAHADENATLGLAMLNLAMLSGYGQGAPEDIPAACDLLLRAESLDPGLAEQCRELRDKLEQRAAERAATAEDTAASSSAPEALLPEGEHGTAAEQDGGAETATDAALLRALQRAAERSERSIVVLKGGLVHPLPKGLTFLLPLLAVAPPCAAGWLFSWWWLLSLPFAIVAVLLLASCCRSNLNINYTRKTLRWRKGNRPFSELSATEFCIESRGDKEIVRYLPPREKPATLAVFAGTDARKAARNFLTALLDLLHLQPKAGGDVS